MIPVFFKNSTASRLLPSILLAYARATLENTGGSTLRLGVICAFTHQIRSPGTLCVLERSAFERAGKVGLSRERGASRRVMDLVGRFIQPPCAVSRPSW